MKILRSIVFVVLVCIGQTMIGQTAINVDPFDKVIISQHIETTFVQGDEESVTILDNTETDDKINIEVKENTLRVYLDGAKDITKRKKVKKNGVKMKTSIYKGKVLTVKITYKNIDNLSIRGDQKIVCESLIQQEKLKLQIFGTSQVIFNEVDLEKLDVDVYGESLLTINKGAVDNQNITIYGEAKINLVEIANKNSRVTAYGEAEVTLNTTDLIKISAFGEAKLFYKGTAKIDKGLVIGNSKIQQLN